MPRGGFGPDRPRKDEIGADTGRQLLESLDAYVDARRGQPARAARERHKATPIDFAWLSALLAALLLVGTILPEGLLADERYKSYVEKIVTWFPVTALFGKWVEAPDDLIVLSRTRGYRLAVAAGLALLSALFFVHVTVEAEVQPSTARVVSVNKETRTVPFTDRIRALDVLVSDLNDEGANKTHDRTFHVGLADIFGSWLHVHAEWRLVYTEGFSCPVGQCDRAPSAFSLRLRNGRFDDEVLRDLKDNHIDVVDDHTIRTGFKTPAPIYLRLPAGSYEVHVDQPCDKTLDEDLTISHDDTYPFRFPCS